MKTNPFRAVMLVLLTAVISLGTLHAQLLNVKGVVTDATDNSLIVGCYVKIQGTSLGTLTNIEGQYSISVNKGDTLVFYFFGFKEQIIKVTTKKLNVVLQVDKKLMEENIVIGSATLRPFPVSETRNVVFDTSVSSSDMNTEEYEDFGENSFRSAGDIPLSTFSVDVDVTAYSNMRRFINQGQLPPAEAIRTEELVNYFSYDYKKPDGNDPIRITTEVGDCPWNASHRLVRIGMKAKEIPADHLPTSNLVFLIDVSGSMFGPNRLELVKSSLKLLVNNLRDKDKVAIIVYAGAAGEKLASTPGSDKQKIREAINELEAGGSTAGGEGIQLAYKIAKKNFIEGGNNRIILCTDGDFNVGVSSREGLERLIENERKTGVFLTVLGYGMGNYKDNKIQVLAEKGNGNQAYIDNLQEANKVLVNEFGAMLHTIAKDVKLQVEFNPSQVEAYRLIGYESRLLNDEDFNNDAKDAGEIGAGHTVTAFYEVIPAGVKSDYVGKVDDLKYQKTSESRKIKASKELLTVKLRYKAPDGDVSKKMELSLVDHKSNLVSSDFRFASAVAMLGQLLHDSPFKGDASYDKVIALAKTSLDNDERGYRREFVRLAEAAKGLSKSETK